MITVAHGSATDVGRVREVNEDAVLAAFPVFVVADGMGGYEAGDIASRLTVEQFAQGVGRSDLDRRWAAGRITAAADAVRPTGGGTTVTGIVATTVEGVAHWLVFNVGDSRVYRRTGGEFAQVSVDHSLVQEMVDSGMLAPDEARHHPERNIVTRAIGADDDPVPDFWLVPAVVGDRFVICSDGLTGEVEPVDLAELVCRTDPPQQVADRLVAAAVAAGGRDNVTVVVVDVADVAAPGSTPPAATAADVPTGGMPLGDDRPSPDTRPFTPLTPRRTP